MMPIFSEQEIQEYWDNRRNVIEFAEQIGRAAIAKASQQVQGDRAMELEFTRIMSGISSVDFEFVNGEPRPAPRSGKSVPVILGVAWKVFKATKSMPMQKPEPVGIIGVTDCLNDVVYKLPIGTKLYTDPVPAQASVPEGYTAIKTEVFKWLLGESGDFVCPENDYFRNKPRPYFWRAKLRESVLPAEDNASRKFVDLRQIVEDGSN